MILAAMAVALRGAALGTTLVAPAAELRWQAPESCPTQEVVQTRLAEALAEVPPDSAQEPVVGEAEVVQTDAGFRLRLVVRRGAGGQTDGPGETGDPAGAAREIVAPTCAQVADAAVLIVALAADPTVVERGGLTVAPVAPPDATDPDTADPDSPEVPGTPEPLDVETPTDPATDPATDAAGTVPDPAPADPEVPPDEPPPEVPAEPSPRLPAERTAADDVTARDEDPPRETPRRPLQLGLRVLAGAGFGVLPGPAADLGLSASLEVGRFRAELGAAYWTPSDASAAANSDVGGRFQLWAIEPRGCFVPSVAPSLTLPVCGGLQVGAVHGRGEGDVVPLSAASAWVSAAVGAGLRWRPRALRDRLGLWLRGEVLPALTRPRFGTQASGLIHRVDAVGGRIGAGIEVRLR